MADSAELEDLEAGLASAFWKRLRVHIIDEWGPAGERFQQAVRQAATKDDAMAVHHLKAIVFTQTEIEKLLAWPLQRLIEIKNQAKAHETGPSRRGPL